MCLVAIHQVRAPFRKMNPMTPPWLSLGVYCLFKRLVSSNGIESPGRQPYNKSTISQISVELWLFLPQSYHTIKISRQISDVVASVCSSTPGNGLVNGDEMQFEQAIPLCSQKSQQRPHSLHERIPVRECSPFHPSSSCELRCSACMVAMCSDSSCLNSSRSDSLLSPDANACWMSLTSLSMSYLLRSVWSRCCTYAQNAS